MAITSDDVRGALHRLHLTVRLACSLNSMESSTVVLSSGKAAKETRALNGGLWVRRILRADFLIIENSFAPGPVRTSFMPGVSTCRTMQTRTAVSPPRIS